MLKNLLVKVFLGRGLSTASELLGKAIRHGATTFGGELIAHGYATQDDVTQLTGAALVLVGIGLSVVRTFLGKYA